MSYMLWAMLLAVLLAAIACAPVHQMAPKPMAISPISPEPMTVSHSKPNLQKKAIDQRFGEAQDELRGLKEDLNR